MVDPNSEYESPADASVSAQSEQPAKARKIQFRTILIIFAVLLILISAVFGLIGGRSGDYTFLKQEVSYFSNADGDQTVLFVNGKALGKTIPGDVKKVDSSIDGLVTLFRAEEGERAVYYTLRGKILTQAAGSEDWDFVMLSDSGEGIAYTVEGEDEATLYLYDVSRKKSTRVDSAPHISCTALAPDGESLTYVAWDDYADMTGYFFNGKKSVELGEGVAPFGLSDGGKYIYDLARDEDGSAAINLYNKKGKKVREIGEVDPIALRSFNEDHTQLLYDCDEDTYITVNGKAGKLFCSGGAIPLTPWDTNWNYGTEITWPVGSFYNHCYYSGKDEIVQIGKKTGRSVKLASDVYSPVEISDDGSEIYFINSDGDLRMVKTSWGKRAPDKAVTLAEDVEEFVIGANGSRVYYRTRHDFKLYSVKSSGGKPSQIADNVSYSLAVDKSGLLYFRKDFDYNRGIYDLYVCSDGERASLALDHVEIAGGGHLGYYYFQSGNEIYCTNGSKKLKKVYTFD